MFTVVSALSMVICLISAGGIFGGCFTRYPPQWRYDAAHSALVDGGSVVIIRTTTQPAQEEMSVPFWMLMPLAAVLPILWWQHFLQDRRSRRIGKCVCCGYDLRATPE